MWQATQPGCLPSLLGDGDKKIEKMYDEEKHFCTGWLEQPRQNKNLFYLHNKPHEPAKKGPLPFVRVLFDPPSPQFQQSAGVTPL